MQPFGHAGLNLHAEAGCNLGNGNSALRILVHQVADRLANLRLARRGAGVKQRKQLIDVKRTSGGQ